VRLLFAYGGGLLVAIGAGYAFPVQAFSSHYTHITIGWLVVTVGIVCIGLFVTIEVMSSNEVPDHSPDELTDHQLFAEFSVGSTSVLPSIMMIVDPRRYFREITEKILPNPAYYTREVRLVLEMPSETIEAKESVTYLVPVLTHVRGDQIDDILVTNEPRGALPLLSDLESRGALDAMLLAYAATLVDVDDANVRAAMSPVRTALRRDGPLPQSRGRVHPPPTFDRGLITALSPGARWDSSRNDWWSEITRLADFCAWILENHALLVPMVAKPGERITLSLRYRQPEPVASGGLKNWLRNFAGLQPYQHQLPIPQYLRTASYNVVFECPPAQYVYTARVLDCSDGQHSAVVSATRGWGALNYASLKIRPAEPGALRPTSVTSVVIDARERPPGLVGVTALVSSAQFALIWVFGLFHNSFFPSAGDAGATRCVFTVTSHLGRAITNRLSGRVGGTVHAPVLCHAAAHFEVATLLLALPALLAGWVATRFSRDQMQWTSLAPLLGMVITGVLSITSTALALWKSSGHSLHDGFWVFAHPAWGALMVSSAVLTVDMLVRAFARSLRFQKRLARAGAVERYVI
jgi:hypothetical protein